MAEGLITRKVGHGGKLFIDGTQQKFKECDLKSSETNLIELKKLPSDTSWYKSDCRTSSVVLQNKKHSFFYIVNSSSNISAQYYTWNGSDWVYINNLPMYLPFISAIYNNEIHIFSGSYHYKLDGSTWVQLQSCPINVITVTNLNNEIHIFDTASHYKWNGSSWVSVSIVPSANLWYSTIYKNEINYLGTTEHYKWNGSSWVSVSTLPQTYASIYGGIFIEYYDDFLALGGSSISNSSNSFYNWDGTKWNKLTNLKRYIIKGSSAINFNNYIEIEEIPDDNYYSGHYKFAYVYTVDKFI